MAVKQQNALVAHWEWFVAAVGVLALVAAIVFLISSLGESPDDAAQTMNSRLAAYKPQHDGVKAADLSLFENVLKGAKNPPALRSVDPKKASFLVSERRIVCEGKDGFKKGCGLPIPADAKVCPFCKTEQPELVQVKIDNDGDGLPNDWEIRHGLNPNDPKDALADADGDTFTNLEEFEAKTDPRDKASHPDYLDFLQVSGPLKQTFLPFWFKAANKIPSGYRFTLQRRDMKSAYNTAYTPVKGEEIGKTGYVAGDYTEKSEERAIKGSRSGAKRRVDVSTLEITRKDDGKKLLLTIGQTRIPVETLVELAWSRGGGTRITAREGAEFNLNGEKYKIVKLREVEKKAEVTVECVRTKAQKVIVSP